MTKVVADGHIFLADSLLLEFLVVVFVDCVSYVLASFECTLLYVKKYSFLIPHLSLFLPLEDICGYSDGWVKQGGFRLFHINLGSERYV